MISPDGAKILSQKEISVQYYVDCFLRRQYGPGDENAPSDKEIEEWCRKAATNLHRSELRRLIARLKTMFNERYPGRKK